MWTIGYGHTKGVIKGMKISKEEAEELLKQDVSIVELQVVNTVGKLAACKIDALVSFAYNVGNIDQLTSKGTRTKKEIADAMLLYIKSGGNVLDGLRKRRNKERELFLKCSTSNFYQKYNGASKDIDVVLSSIGVNSKFYGNYKKRIPLAEVNGIENYTSLKAGAGIVTDIGYQSQTSTYSFETNNFEIAGLKQAYTTALKNYLNDRTIKIASNEEVKKAYATFIKRLTEVVNKYKEENSID